MRSDPRAPAPPPAAWTLRVAVWSARHPWRTAAGWLGLTIGLFVVSLSLGGIRAASATGGGASETEAARAARALRGIGPAAGSEALTVVVTSHGPKVTDPTIRTIVGEIVARLDATTATIDGTKVPAIAGLADPYTAPPSAGLVAPDLTSIRIAGRLEGGPAAVSARTRAIEPVLSSIQADFSSVEVHALSDTLLTDQMAEEIDRDLDASLLISLPATFLILVLAFGAVVAAGVPLLLAVSALLAAFGLFGIFSRTVEPVSPFASQFIVLIGLAVAVDYSLFVISRFRAERRAGLEPVAAIAAASATSGRAVLFSGVAVMISLAALFLLPDPLFQSIAIGTIAVIGVSVAGSLVFLPAILSLLRDGLDRGAIPFLRGRSRGAGAWGSIAAAAMRRPVVAAAGCAVLLLVLASPAARLRLGEGDISQSPERIDGVRAVRALQAHWPQGALLTLDVALSGAHRPELEAAARRIEPALLALPGLSGPVQRASSADGTTMSLSLVMAGGQNDPANWLTVERVREDLVPAALGDPADLRADVGGAAATSLDQTEIYREGLVRIVVFVLGLSFLLLLVVFRSVAIPIKAILLNLLATGAAFGAMVLVFQEGWFGSQLGLASNDVIQNFVPLFVFTALFGLSMDYEVFILSRVREAHDAGATTAEAVQRGIGLTAGTVTSAAAIMVVVFSIFVSLPLPIARELGLGMAVAVLVDATIIRTVLLPATMRLLGDWNWWLPRWLGWLPTIEIEATPSAVRPSAATGAPLLPSGTGAALR